MFIKLRLLSCKHGGEYFEQSMINSVHDMDKGIDKPTFNLQNQQI